jgi:hypothetical protein
LISIPLAIYFAFETQKTRELTYSVSPARTIVVKAGEVSELSVSYKGEPVATDVSIVQVQLWNEGRESIRQGNMHEPLVISTADSTPILETRIRQQTRPSVVRLTHDESQKDKGRIGVSWNILEHRDGGSVQLIIAGNPEVKVIAEAVIEEQGPIRAVISSRGLKGIWLWAWVVLASLVMLAVVPVVNFIRRPRRARRIAAQLEQYLNPAVPTDLDVLREVSIVYRPWWEQWMSWYIPNGYLLVFTLVLIGLDLWVLLRVASTPMPPLAF